MMRQFLLAVAAIMLTCSLVIGIGSSTAGPKSKSGMKLIKIWVDKDSGQVRDVKLKKDDGTEQDATMINQIPPSQYIGTILFYKNNSNCTVIYAGNYARQVCYPSMKAPAGIKVR
jgi:hypothetical protein